MRALIFLMLCAIVFSSCEQKKESKSTFLSDYQVLPAGFELKKSDTFRILSWNVEHFVDTYDNPYVNNRRENNPDSALLAEKAELFTQALLKADADIVVLQEIEHIQLAKKLAETHFPELNYQFFADAESINWYQNVVVMSRLPLGVMYSYGSVHSPVSYMDKDSVEQYQTQNYINTRLWTIEVQADNEYSFYLSSAHLKAGRGPRNEAMRLGQIEFLKEQYARFYRENPEANLMVAGDFNSYPDSREVKAFLEGVENTPFYDLLPADVMTHTSDDPKRRLDYMLLNENMRPELVEGSLVVPMFLPAEQMRKVSDHLPVMADFISEDRQIAL